MRHVYRFLLYAVGYVVVVVVPLLSGLALLAGGKLLLTSKWNFVLFGCEVLSLLLAAGSLFLLFKLGDLSSIINYVLSLLLITSFWITSLAGSFSLSPPDSVASPPSLIYPAVMWSLYLLFVLVVWRNGALALLSAVAGVLVSYALSFRTPVFYFFRGSLLLGTGWGLFHVVFSLALLAVLALFATATESLAEAEYSKSQSFFRVSFPLYGVLVLLSLMALPFAPPPPYSTPPVERFSGNGFVAVKGGDIEAFTTSPRYSAVVKELQAKMESGNLSFTYSPTVGAPGTPEERDVLVELLLRALKKGYRINENFYVLLVQSLYYDRQLSSEDLLLLLNRFNLVSFENWKPERVEELLFELVLNQRAYQLAEFYARVVGAEKESQLRKMVVEREKSLPAEKRRVYVHVYLPEKAEGSKPQLAFLPEDAEANDWWRTRFTTLSSDYEERIFVGDYFPVLFYPEVSEWAEVFPYSSLASGLKVRGEENESVSFDVFLNGKHLHKVYSYVQKHTERMIVWERVEGESVVYDFYFARKVGNGRYQVEKIKSSSSPVLLESDTEKYVGVPGFFFVEARSGDVFLGSSLTLDYVFNYVYRGDIK